MWICSTTNFIILNDQGLHSLNQWNINSIINVFPFILTGTGTFGRVVLCRNKETKDYHALKVLQIALVIRLKQIEHVKNEKEILAAVSCPFIVNMWVHLYTE